MENVLVTKVFERGRGRERDDRRRRGVIMRKTVWFPRGRRIGGKDGKERKKVDKSCSEAHHS